MKIQAVQFAGNHNFIGLRMAASVLAVGDAADASWGGGTVKSLDYDRPTNSLIVRKTVPFVHLGGALKPFDYVAIPWDHIEMARVLEDDVPQGPKK